MGRSLRPTTSLVLGALLNIVGDVYGVRFLDLFAGTGNVGFKVLEKGADMVVWVEKDKLLASAIRERLKGMGINSGFVVGMDVLRALRYLYDKGLKFDIVFMDPPYGKGYVERVVRLIRRFSVVGEGGWLIAEYRKGDVDKEIVEKEYIYGDTALGILKIDNIPKEE